MRKNIIKDLEKAVLFGLIFSVAVSISRFDASCEDMRQNILRIHITANSDSDEDQQVKLKVRDEILKESNGLFDGCKEKADAEKTVKKNLSRFEKAANSVLAKNGFSYKATVKLGKNFFGTRDYEDFSLPAGYYDSLIIKLGKGKGKNFWCVIYPNVCIGGSSENLKKGITEKGANIAEHPNKYRIKFKVVEIYENIKKEFIYCFR